MARPKKIIKTNYFEDNNLSETEVKLYLAHHCSKAGFNYYLSLDKDAEEYHNYRSIINERSIEFYKQKFDRSSIKEAWDAIIENQV
jgi:hypothetical protein